jgi:hypothetical protein
MSHFVVGVIVPKDSDYNVIEDVLAPYDENAEYDFKNCSEEIEKEYANNTLTMYRTNDLDLICEYSRNIPTKPKEGGLSWEKEKDIPEDWVKVEVPYSVLYPTIEDYVDSMDYKYHGNLPGYWYNKNAKWDWWVIGGRWDGYFDGKNVINVRNFNTGINLEAYNEALQEWKDWEDGKDVENFRLSFYKPEFIREFYKNAETYARIQSTPYMRAIITPDGEWHEVGEMGWWGCSDETGEDLLDWVDHFAERFILPYSNGDYEIVAVDCHI